MKIIEMNSGKKMDHAVNGTLLTLDGGRLAVDLQKYQKDYPITLDFVTDGEGNLTLLEPGRAIAERIYSRHRLLTHFFVQLGVDEAIAAEDACKAEHILSEQTLEKIREYALLHDAQDSVKPQGE